MNTFERLITTIENEVFKRRPILKDIVSESGNQNLLSYIRNWEAGSAVGADSLFLECFAHVTSEIYGPAVAAKAKEQLLRKLLVSTIDHHGVWNHPIFVNAAVMHSLHFSDDEFVITLPTESVSLNNTSSWSASFLLQENHAVHRYSIFPDRLKTLPVFSVPSFTLEEVGRLESKSSSMQTLSEAAGLRKFVGQKSFSQQASMCTSELWHKVFPDAPRLLYLPLETIINDYIAAIAPDTTHVLHKILFTKEGQKLWKKYFGDEHSYMFWEIDLHGKRQKMQDFLFTPEQTIHALSKRKMYPTSPLCFVSLLYAGVTCVGGFTQTTWLTRVAENFIKLLEEIGETEKAHTVSQNRTKHFAEGALVLLSHKNVWSRPSAGEILLEGGMTYAHLRGVAERMSLGQSIRFNMSTIYKVVVPTQAQEVKNVDDIEQKLIMEMGHLYHD